VKIILSVVILLATFAAPAEASSTIVVSAPWSRPATGTGVVYLTISNRAATPDRLIAGSSPVAGALELHKTSETKGSTDSMGSMSGMSMGGVVSMHQVAFVPVGANGTVKLAPGGYHIMLVGLHHDLLAGHTFPVRLHFAHAGWVTAIVHVQSM
jgi:copper(I)-binding protein